MAPGSSRRANAPRREVDLGTILTAEQKTDFACLVVKITDSMQRQLCKVFDFTDADTKAPVPQRPWHIRFPVYLRDTSLSLLREDNKPPSHNNASQNKAIQRESHGPKLVELKKEALAVFKKWQGSVQRRINELSTRSPLAKQGQSYASVASFASKAGGASGVASGKSRAKTIAVEADDALLQLYPPISTTLCSLPLDKRTLLLHLMLLLLLSLESYGANSRILLLHLTSSLQVSLHVLTDDELRVANCLSKMVKDLTPDEVARQKSEESRNSRRWKGGSAGGTSAAVAGGNSVLPAPLVTAGIGSVPGGMGLGTAIAAGLLGAMGESSIVVGSLFGFYGVRATGKVMDLYPTKDAPDFALLSLHGVGALSEYRDARDITPPDRRLRVTVCISGWLNNTADDVVNPWRALGHQSEVFALRWELESLIKMGSALETVTRSTAWSVARKEIMARTIFAALLDGSWPVGLLKVSKIVDNPWSICMVRADKAGVMLADVIMNKVQGERGVTLIGYSLGARVIYTCLMTLAERRQFGLVESVVMMGAPAPSQSRIWSIMKSVVAGRMVNVYSENDYILGFMYRTSTIQYGVAGLQAIDGGFGVENVDASDVVSSHLRYRQLVGNILKHICWDDLDLEQVAREAEILNPVKKIREREQKRGTFVSSVEEAVQRKMGIREKNGEKLAVQPEKKQVAK